MQIIHNAWVGWIRSAVEAGAFRRVDPQLSGSLLEAAYLGLISSERPSLVANIGVTSDSFADLMLGGLVAEPTRLDDIRRLALERDGKNPILNRVLHLDPPGHTSQSA